MALRMLQVKKGTQQTRKTPEREYKKIRNVSHNLLYKQTAVGDTRSYYDVQR